MIDEVQKQLITKLEETVIGNPDNKEVRMGALASKIQVERVKENVDLLMKIQEKVYGNYDDFSILDASKKKGAFFPQFYLETTNHF